MTAEPAPTRPGPERAAAPRGMAALGAALGTSVWWCEQLFAATGAWVPEVPEAPVRVHLAELSRLLGEHAVAIGRHLPRPEGTDPRSWVTSPGEGADAALHTVAGESTSVARLAALHRGVAPHLLVRWHAQIGDATPADRGVARTLGHAHSDLLALWLDGEDLLQGLLRSEPAAAGEVGRVVSAVEGHLATVPGSGPGRLTGP